MLLCDLSVLVISAMFLVIDVRSQKCGKSPVILAEEGKAVNATEGSWPWMVAITRTEAARRRVICAGFLIDDIHLLSAAHCFDGRKNYTSLEMWTEQFSALIGSVHPEDTEEYYIDHITTHADYKRGQYYNDIAILKLSVRVAFPGFNPVCLEKIMANQLLTDFKATEVGWNTLSMDPITNLKQLSGFEFVSNYDCMRRYKDVPGLARILYRGSGLLCAMNPNKNYLCLGESGAPLMILNRGRWSAVGLASFGHNNCRMSHLPTGYTRVTPYLDWIKENIRMK